MTHRRVGPIESGAPLVPWWRRRPASCQPPVRDGACAFVAVSGNDSVMVGREQELEALVGAARLVVSGKPTTVLVTGVAGVGNPAGC